MGVAFWLDRRLKSLEQAQWSKQKVIERRIEAYDDLVGPLNDLFCFYCYVGGWTEFDPPAVIKLKRTLDRTTDTNAPLFERRFIDLYEAFMGACFVTFQNWGEDARLRTLPDRREQVLEATGGQHGKCFVEDRDNEVSDLDDVKRDYSRLVAYLGEAIGAREVDAHLFHGTPVPGNFESRAAAMVSRIGSPDKVIDSP